MKRALRLGLTARLTLSFAVVALLPTAFVSFGAQRLVAQRYRREFARTLDDAQRDVWTAYDRAGRDVRDAVLRVARPDDALVGQLLLDLGKGGPGGASGLDDETERALVVRVPEQMRALGLDSFTLLDQRGTILASGHYPGRAGTVDEAHLAEVRRQPGVPVLSRERVEVRGETRESLQIEVAVRVQNDFAQVIVVGGRELAPTLLDRLRLPAHLVDEAGRELAAQPGGFPSAAYPHRSIELPEAQPPVRVEVAVPDEELTRALAWIRAASGVVAAGGLALAVLLGALLARRIARPLGELSDGAKSVAAGDLAREVPVRGDDEVADLARTFNAMTRDLAAASQRLLVAERVAAWRDIAQRIAHEIKNPLTPIQMAIETLQRARKARPDLFDEIFEESSRTILDEVGRLKHIASEFSSFARMPEPRFAAVDVRELVVSALGLYAGEGEKFRHALDGNLPAVRADREQLQQVLRNLLENSRDAVANVDGAQVVVRAARNGARVELEVVDNGPGLPDAVRTKLFTPYFTTKPHGTGLGLAIVQRIVSDHGGEIRVESEAGRGARFVVSLPVAENATGA